MMGLFTDSIAIKEAGVPGTPYTAWSCKVTEIDCWMDGIFVLDWSVFKASILFFQYNSGHRHLRQHDKIKSAVSYDRSSTTSTLNLKVTISTYSLNSTLLL